MFQVIFIMSGINYSELTYSRPGGRLYVFPDWAVRVGWLIAVSSALFIPLTAAYKIVTECLLKNKVGYGYGV